MRFRIRRPADPPTVPYPEDPAPTAAVDTAQPEVAEAPLSDHEIALIRASVAVVEPLAADMTVYFYAILFTRYPEVRPMFPPGMDTQRGRLLRALLRIVDLVDDPENLVRFCGHLGRDHRKFGALREHFPAVGECLLASLARYAGPAWTADIAAAWTKAYGAVADVMISAAEQDATVRPAVWPATIVHLVPCGPGIAEVTLRPHLPYEYAAGQYASIETPWHPKQWRYYSPANAPREDGTLTFHVRAVPGGPVSNALVHRAAVGDVVHLGAPMGDMVLDAAVHSDLLCVAGGTGLAPIRALIEDVARRGGRHQVNLFIGARTGAELYGVDDMLRMAQRHHWLTVRGAVSDEYIPGIRGSLPEVLAEYGPWYQHDVFLSGPAPMVTSARQTLTHGGTSPDHIHHDPFDTPVLTTP
ncbi:FAD-binding oxidoreductase [Streptomyces sp. P9(2023)]|uniref:globin domain-containing protein n=1 Tax=Streptomyces sp. P9(2023) TaxID=3064394 RepID=UPI0028F4209D|nr:globin domain-containing protein [Streptomyces sp. P9(2023)]MDT9687572.1 FAD-binding oxidoreductase [Streptomyces sp. P9(2023)]